MLLLAIDTAGPNCAVALARAGAGEPAMLARTEERLGRGHAERLVPMIEAALAEAGLTFSDLDRIAVATGPGSFTGVRVGVAAARALALSLNIPAVGIGSLAALALPLRRASPAGTAIAVLDAKRGEAYVRVADLASGAVLVEAAAMPLPALAAMLASATRPLILTGSAAPALAALLADARTSVERAAEYPDIADVARLGLEAAADRPPVPLYARGADAKPQGDKAVARR